MSEFAWTASSAAASALLVLGVTCALGAHGLVWLLRGVAADAAIRRALTVAAGATFLVIVGAAVRVVAQSMALAATPAEWASMVRPVLLDSQLGRAMLLQVGSATVAGFAMLAARRRRGALALSGIAAFALAFAPGLGGHPAAHDRVVPAMATSVIHVVGIGLWLGTLALLVVAGRLLGDEHLALAVRRFHRVAAIGLGAVVVTGVARLLDIAPPVGTLVDSVWGLALVVKLSAFAVVAAFGWWHWRTADRSLQGARRAATLRSFGAELILAVVVLLATSVLINSAPPERTTPDPLLHDQPA